MAWITAFGVTRCCPAVIVSSLLAADAFSFIPRLPAWSSQRLIRGGVLPLRILDFVQLRFPSLISRENDEGLPLGILENAPVPISISV